MRPELALDLDTVSANARAWIAHTGVPLRAVVKGDGYGWGYSRLVGALESVADAYCVADASELAELRRFTRKPVVVLGDVEPNEFADVIRSGAMPNVNGTIELEIAQRVLAEIGAPPRIRVGVRPAASFSGLPLDEIKTLAPALAQAGTEVELWTHLTDWEGRTAQVETFRNALAAMRAAGVTVAGTDVASTFPAAADGALGSSVRIGVGLFGATGGAAVPGVRCALRVVAPIVRRERHSEGTRLGYGGTMLGMAETIVTARCGYADGLPKTLGGADDILSVGMQYVTARASLLEPGHTELVLLDESTDLDAFAARCARLPHEIVTGFGNCARANGVSVEV